MAGQMTLSGVIDYLKWYQFVEQTQCHRINVDLSRCALLEGRPSGVISSSPLIRPFCRTVARYELACVAIYVRGLILRLMYKYDVVLKREFRWYQRLYRV